MFETPEDYEFAVFDDSLPQEIRLGPGDQITIQILTNDGYTMLTPGLVSPVGGYSNEGNTFEVDLKGFVRLPFVDTLFLQGLTIRESESRIERAFKTYFKEPFAQVKVINRRAFIFPASQEGQVVVLNSENITLIEVIAQAGGIPSTGKAYNIKLVRNIGGNQYSMALIDLRDVEALQQTDIIIRHRDIIYIDPIFETTLLTQVTPFFVFLGSLVSLATLFAVLNR